MAPTWVGSPVRGQTLTSSVTQESPGRPLSFEQRQVWMVISGFYPGIAGEELLTQADCKSLIERGWPVRVLTRRHGYPQLGPLSGSDAVDGIPLTRVYARGGRRIGALLFVLNGLRYLGWRGRRAVYHARDIGAPGWLAVIAARLLGGRSIIKLSAGRDAYERRIRSRLTRWQVTRLLRMADRVVVVNKELEGLMKQLGVPEPRVVRIPNAIDTGHFRPPSADEKAKACNALELPADRSMALYVGRLVPVKGLDTLLRAWALLAADIRGRGLLVLLGHGKERDTLEAMVESLGLQDSVRLAGEQRAVRDYYWAADFFVLPSRSEGLSRALIEAMSCGLPVVASSVGGAMEVVRVNENGFLFQAGDHRQLAENVSWMLNAADRRGDLGTEARRAVIDYADLDAAVERLSGLYIELA